MYLLELEAQLHVLWPYPVAVIANEAGTESIRVFCHSSRYELASQFVANCRRLTRIDEDGYQHWETEIFFAVGLSALMAKVRVQYSLIDAPGWSLSSS